MKNKYYFIKTQDIWSNGESTTDFNKSFDGIYPYIAFYLCFQIQNNYSEGLGVSTESWSLRALRVYLVLASFALMASILVNNLREGGRGSVTSTYGT